MTRIKNPRSFLPLNKVEGTWVFYSPGVWWEGLFMLTLRLALQNVF